MIKHNHISLYISKYLQLDANLSMRLFAFQLIIYLFSVYLYPTLQCEALGFSIWRRNEVYSSQVLWITAPTEGTHTTYS